MFAIFLDVLPIFALIALGWTTIATRFLKPEVGEALGDFVFKIGIPVLLFRTVATANFDGHPPFALWAAYFSGVAVTWTAGHLAATRLFGRDARVGVVAGVSSGFANTVFVGLPLVQRFLGDEGLVPLALLLSVHLPVMMVAGTLMMERAGRSVTGQPSRGVGAVLMQVVRTLVRNPLVLGLLAGSVVRMLHLPMEGPHRVVIDLLAGTAGPMALVSIGMAVHRYGIAGNVGPAIATSVLKLVLLPASVFVGARVVGLDPVQTAAMVLTASVPTGVNAYMIANHFGVGHALASSSITITTLAGILTVTGWAVLLGL